MSAYVGDYAIDAMPGHLVVRIVAPPWRSAIDREDSLRMAEVLDMGPPPLDNDVCSMLGAGGLVALHKFSGVTLTIDGEELLVVRYDDVAAIVRSKTEQTS